MVRKALTPSVIPGCARFGRRPGIHNLESWLWIPGSRVKDARPGMTDRCAVPPHLHAQYFITALDLTAAADEVAGRARPLDSIQRSSRLCPGLAPGLGAACRGGADRLARQR